MATKFLYWLVAIFLFLDLGLKAGNATLQPRAPNFQYFERLRGRICPPLDVLPQLISINTTISAVEGQNFERYNRGSSRGGGRQQNQLLVTNRIPKTAAHDRLQWRLSNVVYRPTVGPKYRYPYYDLNGKGKLLYGYGGTDLYQYKAYSPLEGIH